MLIVHPHLHRRRTGITRHVEAMLRGLASSADARALGSALQPQVPRIGWGELWRAARDGEVVWHAHRNNELAVGLVLRWFRRRVRLVFTRHASTPAGWVTRALAARADRRISLTPEVAGGLGLPSDRVAHGVDVNVFRPPDDRQACWARLGLGGQWGVGVIGRVRRTKGQGDFAAAVAPLLAQHPSWRAVLVGLAKGGDQRWVRGLQAAAGPGLRVVGEQAEIAPWYQGLTVLVHPSYAEALSLVLLEALASGCCVIATRLPYVRDLIEDGRTGFLYPPGDVVELRRLLAMLMADPARAQAVGAAAAEQARKTFRVEDEVRGLLEVYRSALEPR